MGTTISNGSLLYGNGTGTTAGLYMNGTGSTLTGFNTIEKPKMKQVKVAIFNVTRDENYDIIDSTFDQEVWVCQKKGVSLEAATMKQLGYVIDPDVKIIREVLSITI
jgi:hypothetical protein